MRNTFARLTLAAALVGLSATQFGATAQPSITVGAAAPAFTLNDTDGKPVSLGDYAGKTVVIEWTNPECPFVQRHYAAKTMTTLADGYKDKGVVWLAVNSTGTQTTAGNKAWIAQNHMGYPILNDASGAVGHLYGAKTTPEMFVVDKAGTLVYAGGIDNDPEGTKTSDKVNYVKAALDETLAGKPVEMAKTKSYGCGVHYAK